MGVAIVSTCAYGRGHRVRSDIGVWSLFLQIHMGVVTDGVWLVFVRDCNQLRSVFLYKHVNVSIVSIWPCGRGYCFYRCIWEWSSFQVGVVTSCVVLQVAQD